MPKLQKSSKSTGSREFVFSAEEKRMLKKLGDLIRSDLKTKKISVEAMAEKLGIARSTLREIIYGQSNVRILTLQAIAKGVGHRDLASFLKRL
jgi:transcriptional regulator with XRE-family HTH domain